MRLNAEVVDPSRAGSSFTQFTPTLPGIQVPPNTSRGPRRVTDSIVCPLCQAPGGGPPWAGVTRFANQEFRYRWPVPAPPAGCASRSPTPSSTSTARSVKRGRPGPNTVYRRIERHQFSIEVSTDSETVAADAASDG